ncbi:conserved oligomeric golgi complex subunit 2 [Cystoisospora suis]|uniref:Conserved oligomeric golgi complex subunit 2 n=1 Tax=Cystoisospora suis TaxID=483139 RepID=A0A2C6KQ58_9APIC|nr:conserved oligomeric golgi complex subunit 2 [Cystoisospora suis]
MEGGAPVSSPTSSLFVVPSRPSTDIRSSLAQTYLSDRSEVSSGASSTRQSVRTLADRIQTFSGKRGGTGHSGGPSAGHISNGSDSGAASSSSSSQILLNGDSRKNGKDRLSSSEETKPDRSSTRDGKSSESAEESHGHVPGTGTSPEETIEDLNPLAYVLEKRKHSPLSLLHSSLSSSCSSLENQLLSFLQSNYVEISAIASDLDEADGDLHPILAPLSEYKARAERIFHQLNNQRVAVELLLRNKGSALKRRRYLRLLSRSYQIFKRIVSDLHTLLNSDFPVSSSSSPPSSSCLDTSDTTPGIREHQISSSSSPPSSDSSHDLPSREKNVSFMSVVSSSSLSSRLSQQDRGKNPCENRSTNSSTSFSPGSGDRLGTHLDRNGEGLHDRRESPVNSLQKDDEEQQKHVDKKENRGRLILEDMTSTVLSLIQKAPILIFLNEEKGRWRTSSSSSVSTGGGIERGPARGEGENCALLDTRQKDLRFGDTYPGPSSSSFSSFTYLFESPILEKARQERFGAMLRAAEHVTAEEKNGEDDSSLFIKKAWNRQGEDRYIEGHDKIGILGMNPMREGGLLKRYVGLETVVKDLNKLRECLLAAKPFFTDVEREETPSSSSSPSCLSLADLQMHVQQQLSSNVENVDSSSSLDETSSPTHSASPAAPSCPSSSPPVLSPSPPLHSSSNNHFPTSSCESSGKESVQKPTSALSQGLPLELSHLQVAAEMLEKALQARLMREIQGLLQSLCISAFSFHKERKEAPAPLPATTQEKKVWVKEGIACSSESLEQLEEHGDGVASQDRRGEEHVEEEWMLALEHLLRPVLEHAKGTGKEEGSEVEALIRHFFVDRLIQDALQVSRQFSRGGEREGFSHPSSQPGAGRKEALVYRRFLVAVIAGLSTQPSVFLWLASRLSTGAHRRASCLYQHALRESLTSTRANDLSSQDCEETPTEEQPSSKKNDSSFMKEERKLRQRDREDSSCQSLQRPTTTSGRYGWCCCCCIYNAVEEGKGREGRGCSSLEEYEGERTFEGQREGRERIRGKEEKGHEEGRSSGGLNKKKIENDRRNCLCGKRLQSRLYLLSDVLGIELLKTIDSSFSSMFKPAFKGTFLSTYSDTLQFFSVLESWMSPCEVSRFRSFPAMQILQARWSMPLWCSICEAQQQEQLHQQLLCDERLVDSSDGLHHQKPIPYMGQTFWFLSSILLLRLLRYRFNHNPSRHLFFLSDPLLSPFLFSSVKNHSSDKRERNIPFSSSCSTGFSITWMKKDVAEALLATTTFSSLDLSECSSLGYEEDTCLFHTRNEKQRAAKLFSSRCLPQSLSFLVSIIKVYIDAGPAIARSSGAGVLTKGVVPTAQGLSTHQQQTSSSPQSTGGGVGSPGGGPPPLTSGDSLDSSSRAGGGSPTVHLSCFRILRLLADYGAVVQWLQAPSTPPSLCWVLSPSRLSSPSASHPFLSALGVSFPAALREKEQERSTISSQSSQTAERNQKDDHHHIKTIHPLGSTPNNNVSTSPSSSLSSSALSPAMSPLFEAALWQVVHGVTEALEALPGHCCGGCFKGGEDKEEEEEENEREGNAEKERDMDHRSCEIYAKQKLREGSQLVVSLWRIFRHASYLLREAQIHLEQQALVYIQQMTKRNLLPLRSIPAGYRMTSKQAPRTASSYVERTLQPLAAFGAFADDVLPSNLVQSLMQRSVNITTELWCEEAEKMLKTEEQKEMSLLRLQRGGGNHTSGQHGAGSASVSDLDKMKLQLLLVRSGETPVSAVTSCVVRIP